MLADLLSWRCWDSGFKHVLAWLSKTDEGEAERGDEAKISR